ncbi:MAG: hypothetical protein JNJ99_02695, partial [Crocinitomicaceae bacterium]|nr:hypothetical protein [Crocinitomicaceae bacterium]
KPGDAWPKQRLEEIDRILHPEKYIADSNTLPDYGDPINTTDVDIQGMLMEAEEQRQFMADQKVDQQRVSAEEANQSDDLKQTDISHETTKEAHQMNQDLEEMEWSAEVKRTEANLEVVDMQIQLEETETGFETSNENDVQHANQGVTNLNVEIEKRNENDDLPREEYLADVEKIKVEVSYEEEMNDKDQTDVVHDQTNYVEKVQVEHVSADPNMDVERKNGEVYVEDLNVTLINELNQNTWSQEDEVMGVKNSTEELHEERVANDINNDIPREEGVANLADYTLSKENADRNQADDQYDETVDVKNHGEKMQIEIEINNNDNDIPRQQTEEKVENSEVVISEYIGDKSGDQNNVVNASDDKLDNFEIALEDQNLYNDRPREDGEKDVVALDDEIKSTHSNMSDLNEDNSHTTVGQTEDLRDVQTTFNTAADVKNTDNSDNTNEAVEDLLEENKTISDGNDEEVDRIEDYTEELKHMDVQNDNEPMKNKLGEDYPEGVTEEVYAMNDENGLLSKYIVRRIVVINGTGYNYEKIQTRYGTITYTRDGQPISEFQWTDETEAATLTRN